MLTSIRIWCVSLIMKVERWNSVSCSFDMHSASSYFEFMLLSFIDNFLCLVSCDLLLNLVLFLYFCLNCICIYIYQSNFTSIVLLYYKSKVQVGCLLSPCDSRWIFAFLSVSDEVQEAQFQEPDQEEAAGSVWCVVVMYFWRMVTYVHTCFKNMTL